MSVALLLLACAAVTRALVVEAQASTPTPMPPGARVDRLLVRKADRTLQAFSGDRLVATFRAAMGRGGLGPKRMEGDGRTPEGQYRIDSRHHSREFHRFLHVSYPNREDRARYRAGRRDGTIPAGTGIGGDIGVHGTPSWAALIPFSREVGWTEGCIAIASNEAQQLYEAVVPDAPIEILP
ncbi:MAG: L,D-transpeptidase family protein [Polyangiales bacterium]|nr:L,D-transpeptidase family protein [Myxococcales bacterium]MCB9659336.1 L,D-transpeptidase family protein [Sandaracinaceae bacterium]